MFEVLEARVENLFNAAKLCAPEIAHIVEAAIYCIEPAIYSIKPAIHSFKLVVHRIQSRVEVGHQQPDQKSVQQHWYPDRKVELRIGHTDECLTHATILT